MKKAISLLLALTIVFALAACGAKTEAPAAAPVQPTAPAEAAPVEAAPVNDGTVTLADGSKYPIEPVTILCGWAAGGGSDMMCQMVATLIERYTGVSANVSYMEGGDGTVCLTYMADNAEADGYTMALCSSGQFNVKPYTQDVTYDVEDFMFLTSVSEDCYGLFANPETGFKTIDDVVKYYSENPDKVLNYGMSGSNGAPHLYTQMMWNELGLTNTQVISYDGAATALTACLGGEVDMIVITPNVAQTSYDEGSLNGLVMLKDNRLTTMPEVPTLGECGYEPIAAGTQKSFLVPAATDPAVGEYWEAKFEEMWQDQEWQDYLESINAIQSTLTGTEYKDRVMSAIANFWPLMENMGILKADAVKPDFVK